MKDALVGGSPFSPDGDMAPSSTAVVLVGFQNEYFAPSGALYGDIADVGAPERVLAATVGLVDRLVATETLIVTAPIVFTRSYAELLPPVVGILAAVKARGAFQLGTDGALTVEELRQFGSRIVEVGGRRGLDAFSNTVLDESLAARGIVDVVIAGALTCVCIDSTARSAHERGYRVTVLSDCTMGSTRSEHDLFCERIFPLYAEVITSDEVADRLLVASPTSP
jgi:nicotinamidase-related amidase